MAAKQQAGPTAPSDEEIWGALPLVLGGVKKPIRQLAAYPNEDWCALVTERFQTMLGQGRLSSQDWGGIAALAAGQTRLQIELLVAYDREGRLGGEEWIGNNASAAEIYEAFKLVLQAAFPFLADAARFPQLLAGLLPQLLAISGSSGSAPGGDPETN